MSIKVVKENPFFDLKNFTTSTIALDEISKIMLSYHIQSKLGNPPGMTTLITVNQKDKKILEEFRYKYLLRFHI